VPRGALFDETVDCLADVGLDVAPLRDLGRRLVVDADDVRYITTRPSDVATFVEAGAADIGIAGTDVLREYAPDVFELLDLGFGACRMIYATVAGDDPTPEVLERLGAVRVATKYPNAARQYFERTGRACEVIKVNGSVELAPLVGLAHGIVDLTATGRTLVENGLVERDEIYRSSARLIANRVSHQVKADIIDPLVARFAAAVP
jgi:ATP phosphoribosyltransferase